MPPLFRIAPQSPRPRVLAALVLGGHLGLSMAQGLPRPEAWEAGVVLDVASSSQALALGAREALRPGRLHWDGLAWWYTPATRLADAVDAMAIEPQVLWDVGDGLLLQLRSQEAGWQLPRYTWLSARQVQGLPPSGAPGRWHALRCALYGQDIL